MTANLRRTAACAAFLLSALFVTACGPSIDAASKADIDSRLALLQPGASTFPAPPSFDPMPLAPGQWSQYKLVDNKGQPGFVTYKVLSAENDAFWIEVLHETYFGRTGQKMLVAFGNRTDPSQMDLRAIVTLDKRGNVNPMPPAMMSFIQGSFRGVLSSLVMSWLGLPQEPATVSAGRFDGCYHGRTTAQWGPYKSTADYWSSPAVPISGVVRSQGIDHPFTMELVAFGTSGATADF